LENLKGLILAGGFATRFKGKKCLALLQQKPLINWVYTALEPFCHEIWISLRPDQEKIVFPAKLANTRFVFDENPGAGPAAAISTALKVAPESAFLVVPCDQPLLKKSLLQYLLKKFESNPLLEALAFSDEKGRLLPFPGIYRKGLQKGSLREIFKTCQGEIIPPAEWRTYDPAGLSFFNINYREDLKEAAKLLEQTSGSAACS